MNPLVEVIGLIAGALSLSTSVPQIVRVVRSKSEVGVSLTSWLIFALSVASWTAFGIRYHSLSQIITNAIALVLAGFLSWMLMRTRFTGRVPAPGLFAFLVVLASSIVCAIVVFVSPDTFVNVFLNLFLISRVPQVFESIQSWRVSRLTVVSKSTYTLSIASGIIWTVYGLMIGSIAVIIYSVVFLVLSVIILVFEALAGRRASALAARNAASN